MSDAAAAFTRDAIARQPPGARPFARWSLSDLERQLAAACVSGDGPTGAHCIHEFTMRGVVPLAISRWLERLWIRGGDTIPEWLPMHAVTWLPVAYEVAAQFRPQSRGNRRIYLILLDYADSPRGPHGVYVGMSRHSAAERFEQHKLGIRASGVVLRRGLEPLPGPTMHLEGIARAEAERIETQLAEALRARDLIVRGGH